MITHPEKMLFPGDGITKASWRRITKRSPPSCFLRRMAKRIDEVGDLWSDMPAQPLERAIERLRSST